MMKGSHDGVTSGPSWPGMSVELHNSSRSSFIIQVRACRRAGGKVGILYFYIFYCPRQFIKVPVKEAEERAQRLRGLAALAQDLNSIPSTHVGQSPTTCDFSSKRSSALVWSRRASEYTYILQTHTYTKIK